MKKALLVIDMQNIYFTDEMLVSYPKGSLDKVLEAMDFAKAQGIPIIVVQHSSMQGGFKKGSKTWEICNQIKNKSYDYYIEKYKPSSFYETQLEDILKKEQIDTVVISGYMTHMCCDTTAREAFHLGYYVEFLSDATGTIHLNTPGGQKQSKEIHETVLAIQASRFSKVLTVEEWKGL
ncbi:isochorismatase [Sporanaerobium hydrogeniformans]|uniref:Isochorismatase n=1 Tax=Sporanaerobium hydrogeniformans TaxID=3072179 RepID=A0AC61DEV5_9FIRM|nr:cysteine hydrolase family protein [Sporanaerobium hydrogeniformans]PHV71226.1 isochorismatase [Sporanaerobium hydrogeniformans]